MYLTTLSFVNECCEEGCLKFWLQFDTCLENQKHVKKDVAALCCEEISLPQR